MKNKELRASEMSLLSLFFLVLEFAGAYGYNFMYSIIVSSFPSVSVFSSVTFYSFFRSLQIVFLFSVIILYKEVILHESTYSSNRWKTKCW